MATQRPGRGSTRLGQPAVKAPAPAARPSTGPVPKQAPATGRAGGRQTSTRSAPAAAPPRPSARAAAAPKSNMPLMIGGGVGVVLVLVLAFVFMGGEKKDPAPTPKKEASKSKPVDVSALEKDGTNKCEEGLKLIQKNQSQMGSASLGASQKQAMVADLEKGKKLIADGMGLLTQANEKSGKTYDTKQYQEALITVRKKLMELRD